MTASIRLFYPFSDFINVTLSIICADFHHITIDHNCQKPWITLASPARGHWGTCPTRRQSTASCLIFQVTSEPHKETLTFDSVFAYPVKNSIAYSAYSGTSAAQLLYSSSVSVPVMSVKTLDWGRVDACFILFCCFGFNITQTQCRRRFTFHTCIYRQRFLTNGKMLAELPLRCASLEIRLWSRPITLVLSYQNHNWNSHGG